MAKINFKELSPAESMKYAKDFMKRNKGYRFKQTDFRPGKLLFLKYNAKDKTKIYDRTPLIVVLWRTSKHTLGLNWHWLPFIKRIELVKYVLEINASRVRNRKPLKIEYPMIKSFLKKRGYSPCIRKYLNNRFSKIGFVVPNTQLLGFARLNMMMFTGGIPTEVIYRLAGRKQL